MTTEVTEVVTPEVVSTEVVVDEVVSTEAIPETPVETEVKTVSQEDFNALYFKMKQAERELTNLRDATDRSELDPTPPEEAKTPELEDFDYDDEAYNKAVISQQVQAQVKAALAAQTEAAAQASQVSQKQQIATDFNTKAAAYAATNPEYEKSITASNGLQFPTHIQEVILQSEFGPQLDHMLLANPTLINNLANLSPTQAIMEMGRMESSIKAPAAAPVQVSQAPEPFETGNGAVSTGGDFRYDENLSMSEYYAQTMADLKSRQ